MTHEAGAIAVSQGRGCLSAIPEILEDMRNGRMVVLVDAEERENEGAWLLQMMTEQDKALLSHEAGGVARTPCVRWARRSRVGGGVAR